MGFRLQAEPPTAVACFDRFELALARDAVPGENPFRDVELHGEFQGPDGMVRRVEGFCDAADGTVFRLRFMPQTRGTYTYRVEGTGGWTETGAFEALPSRSKGMVQVRSDYPFHFFWSGTGEPYFWNGGTAYLMAGLAEHLLEPALDRLAGKGINHLRVTLCPMRQPDGGRWYEPQVAERSDFSFLCAPWPACNPTVPLDPQYDVSRFEPSYWHKFETLLELAKARDVNVQVIFFTDGQEDPNYPFDRNRYGEDPDELAYYRYLVARLGSFANVEYCVTNEWALYRPDDKLDEVGASIHSLDAYGHLTTVHGHGHFPFAGSAWCSHALFQSWDEHGGYAFLRERRRQQLETGRAKQQINEEYGYEDHYSLWGENRKAPSRNAESRVRLAWEMAFAGGYSTNGESAKNGLGGWLNGLGDDSMAMLDLQRHLRTFFEAFEWWRCNPVDGLASGHAYALAETGNTYAVYVYGGGSSSLPLPDEGPWDVDAFNPADGTWTRLAEWARLERDPGAGPGYVVPHVPYGETLAILIRRTNRKEFQTFRGMITPHVE